MSAISSGRGQYPSPSTLVVADVLVVVAVLLVGELNHAVNPIESPLRVVGTVLPFLLGWLVFAYVADLYATTVTDVSTSLRRTTVAWVAGANVGLVARTSPFVHGDATWPFGVVVTGFVLVALVAWRGILAYRSR